MELGTSELKSQIEAMGVKTEIMNEDYVCFQYKIPHGRFKEQIIEIALNAPQFPLIPPSGPYIKPHLLPFENGGSHPSGGIHQRNLPTSEFQYWSRPFANWDKSNKDIKTYLAFIRTLFDFL